MIRIFNDKSKAKQIFGHLRDYNNQFEPKVNYRPQAFVVEEDGDLIGGLEGAIAWDNFEIGNMVTLKQRQGIGSILIGHLEGFCREHDVNSITCWTLDFQAPEFYEKKGFEKVAVVPNFAGKHSCHHFIKRL